MKEGLQEMLKVGFTDVIFQCVDVDPLFYKDILVFDFGIYKYAPIVFASLTQASTVSPATSSPSSSSLVTATGGATS